MPEQNLESINAARSALSEMRGTRDAFQYQLSDLRARREALVRVAGPNDDHIGNLDGQIAQLDDALQGAQRAVREHQNRLGELIGAFLGDVGAQEISRLDTSVPLVLLPVRIETRFDSTDNTRILKIRVYPDELLMDTHDTALTAREYAAGVKYWTDSWAQGENLDAWRSLVAPRDAERAAWIVNQTTPDNLAARPDEPPKFPEIGLKADVWNRAGESHVLPDRWIALAYRGGQVVRQALSRPIVEPLALTLNPNADPKEQVDAYGDGLTIARELLWTIDFDEATRVGMALEMPLEGPDIELGFERLLVIGVKASLDADASAQRLGELIENYHYGRGMAFVRQGTPTNNTTDKPAGFPPSDPNTALSFARERITPAPAVDRDGPRFMRALGVDVSLADHLENADLHEQENARAMNVALFPATLGYFLHDMMTPALGANVVDEARGYFGDRVRARGHFPAFRVGSRPYGLLPVSSLARWKPDLLASPAERELPPFLLRLRGIFQKNVSQVPHVGQTSDADGDLARVLAMEASAREIAVRAFVGKNLLINLLVMQGVDPKAILDFMQSAIEMSTLAALGHPEWITRVLNLVNLKAPLLFQHSFVTDDPLSETDPLTPEQNYIAQLANARNADEILAGYKDKEPTALLYQLLRHAMLQQTDRSVSNVLLDIHRIETSALHDREFHAINAPTAAQPTVWQRMATKIPEITGDRNLADYILAPLPTRHNTEMLSYRGALNLLQDLPTAELERLLTETLDLCSHRLDAWIHSLYAARLEVIRTSKPMGAYIGACAWVEDLHLNPTRRVPVELPDGRRVLAQQDNGGYIHAPSMTHASTAAVLRNAYLSHVGQDPQRYEVDLSSGKVRQGTWLLDGVKQGQTTGAVLGYVFERGLHEGHLDQYIDNFRKQFPLVTHPTRDTGLPTEAVTARDVVDGLKLRNAYAQNKSNFFSGLQFLVALQDRAPLLAQLQGLDDAFDPLADLMLAESVFQLMQSNTFGASASLDALVGSPPPDPAVAQQPRGGTTLTHRVALVLNETRGDTTPRAQAEPYLNAWVGRVFGDLNTYRCRVFFIDAPGSPQDVSMADLELAPLDVLAVARSLASAAAPNDPHGSELDQRVADFVQANFNTAKDLSITYNAAFADVNIRTFPELFELAAAVNAVLAKARALRGEDLMLPQEVRDATNPTLVADTRTSDALARLQTAQDALKNANTPALHRAALREASLFGIPQSYPSMDDTVLAAQRDAALKHVTRRVNAATAPGLSEQKIAQAIFGNDFLFLIAFQLEAAHENEWELARTQSPTLVDNKEIQKWFQQAARVRQPLGAWRKLGLYANALDTTHLDFSVAQLPFQNNARWGALRFDGQPPPPAGLLSIVAHEPVPHAPGEPWLGLLLDAWTEILPRATETTAVGLHFDSPAAAAPQAILLAVPPDNASHWSLNTLADVLNETIDLAKLRGADLELLGSLGQVLPMIYLATDVEDNTLSVNFAKLVQTYAQLKTPLARGTP